MKNQIMIAAVSLGLMVGCATREHHASREVSQLPQAVQDAIQQHAPGAVVSDVDRETRDGRVVYEISFKEPGINPEIHIASDGTILQGNRAERMLNEAAGAGPSLGTKFEDLPEAVQSAIRAHAPNAKVADIDKETRTGRVVYEVQFSEPGLNPKMHIAEDGTVLQADK